jgi:hypothetical protein
MERCTHDIVAVASQHGDRQSALPVPNTHCLIVTTGANPRQIVVELNCPYVVQVTLEGKQDFLSFVVPNLDTVIVTTTDKHGLRIMEMHSSDWSLVVLELVKVHSGVVVE